MRGGRESERQMRLTKGRERSVRVKQQRIEHKTYENTDESRNNEAESGSDEVGLRV
jgi:hypothetical protein